MRYLLATLLVAGMTILALPQDTKESKYPVTLTSGEIPSKLAPRYSPPGRQLKLQAKAHPELPGTDHLEAWLVLGPNKQDKGLQLVVARSEPGKPYSLLYLQNQSTGKLNATPVTVKLTTNRNKFWSSFEALVQVNHGKPGEPQQNEPYAVTLWIVVEQEAETPDIIRYSRRGYLHGDVQLGNSHFDVVLSDSNNDGVLGDGDWWELRSKGQATGTMRTVGDFQWAGGKAWKLELTGTRGRTGQVVPFDAGMTEEEDAIKRDKLRVDRLAPRAVQPVAFRKDVDVTLKEAAAGKAVCFIKFETDWCIPCKQMSELVFTSREVADAAKGIICLIVDGDARKDLTEKYKVKAYPTGILLDAEGKEVARYVGYQSVKETSAFLKKVNK